MDKDERDFIAVCTFPCAAIKAHQQIGLARTEEQQRAVAERAIMLHAKLLYKGEKATDIAAIISRDIRHNGSRELIAEFTDGKILELVQAAQIGGADSGNCTERD